MNVINRFFRSNSIIFLLFLSYQEIGIKNGKLLKCYFEKNSSKILKLYFIKYHVREKRTEML